MKHKKFIFIVVCSLFVLSNKGQTSLFFDKYYKVGYPTAQTNNVLILEDSTYAILSYVKDSLTGRQDLGLHKVDKYGNLLVKKVFNCFGLDYLRPGTSFNNFIHSSKASLIAVGAAYSNTTSVIVFSKINKQTLDTSKTFLFSDGLFQYNIGNILKINSNKIFVIGNKTNVSTSQFWPVIFELDTNLIIQNSVTCSNTSTLATYFGMYDENNKKLIIGGGIGSSLLSFISILDTLGNFSNTYINNTCSNFLANIIYSPFDNTYIGIGAKKTSVYGSQTMFRPYICKYDANNLNLIWQKTFGHSNIVNTLYDAVVNSDGSIVTVGRYSDSILNPLTNINCNAVLLKVRSNGDSLWMKQFDNLNNTSGPSNNWWEAFFGIEKTPEGGYIMCGNAQQMPLAQAWVVKTDSLGCALASCMPFSGIKEEMEYQYGNIYPNPASNIIYLNLPKNILNSEIEIINSIGQVVAKYQNHSNKLNIEKLSAGTYFIKLQTENFIPLFYKFVKQ